MGEVWLAELQGAGAFRRRVVIKMLAPERRGDARIACMLADEARLVGLLHHPGIVTAIDYLESETEGPIFVLEFVDGCSLRSALKIARRRNELMPEMLAAHVGAQVARALHAAHTACDSDGHPLHLVHRDISPDNVLLSRSGAVYLGDFGVARARGSAEVSDPAAGPKGKPGYMAPEQATGDPVGPQADVFSLGRVVAEAADIRCGHALRKVLEKATAPKPRHRFQTAAELAAALARVCPPPPDPDGALSEWLHRAAPEALHPWRRARRAQRRATRRPAARGGDALARRSGSAAALRRGGAAAEARAEDRRRPRSAARPVPARRVDRRGCALGARLAPPPGGVPRHQRRAARLQPARGCGGVRRRRTARDHSADARAGRGAAQRARRQPAPLQVAGRGRADAPGLVGTARLRSHRVTAKRSTRSRGGAEIWSFENPNLRVSAPPR